MADILRRRRRTWVVDLSILFLATSAAILYCYLFEVFPRDHKAYAVESDELLLVFGISCCGLVICFFRMLTCQRGEPSHFGVERVLSNYFSFLRTSTPLFRAIHRGDVLPTLSSFGLSIGRMSIASAATGGDASLKKLSRDEWDILAPAFSDLSYRQCSSYAVVAAKNVRAQPEFIGIFDGQKLIGLANVRIKRLPFSSLGLAYINYGPLIAQNAEFSPHLFGTCLAALRKEYVENRRMVLRIVPPLHGGLQQEALAACLEAHGFRPLRSAERHETLILDLSGPLSDIHKQFDRRWRNHLSKAQRSNITVTRSNSLIDFDRLEPIFSKLMREKRFFTQRDVSFFRCMQEDARGEQEVAIHLAWRGDELLAGHIGSFVGDTAVYLLGANNSKGRALRASYLLQWSVIEYAKRVGNVFYDLGGIDPQNNPAVFVFKNGLRGRRVGEVVPYELACGQLSGLALHVAENAYKNAARMSKRVFHCRRVETRVVRS